MKSKLSKIDKKALRSLLKVTNGVDAFMGSEGAHDFFFDTGWNACVNRALSSKTLPKKKKEKLPMDAYAKAQGWNAALIKIKELLKPV